MIPPCLPNFLDNYTLTCKAHSIQFGLFTDHSQVKLVPDSRSHSWHFFHLKYLSNYTTFSEDTVVINWALVNCLKRRKTKRRTTILLQILCFWSTLQDVNKIPNSLFKLWMIYNKGFFSNEKEFYVLWQYKQAFWKQQQRHRKLAMLLHWL